MEEIFDDGDCEMINYEGVEDDYLTIIAKRVYSTLTTDKNLRMKIVIAYLAGGKLTSISSILNTIMFNLLFE